MCLCEALVCILMSVCVCTCFERDQVEQRTWLLEAPRAQSQRQNTNRAIHSRHTSLAPISLPPSTSLSCSVLQPRSFPSYFRRSLSHFYSWFIYTALALSHNSLLPWSTLPPINTTLSNPFMILLPSMLPRLTAHSHPISFFHAMLKYFVSLNKSQDSF